MTGIKEKPSQEEDTKKDSLGIPVKKSPLLVYALLQIPLVIFMVIVLYVMYQQSH